MKLDMILAGVGGQGVLFLSRTIGEAAIFSGLNVRIAGIYGAARRGGSVLVHVRICENEINSPLVPKESADVVASLEPLEGLRASLTYLKTNGLWITNIKPILPTIVRIGQAEYPNIEKIRKITNTINVKLVELDCEGILERIEEQSINMVMLGALFAIGVLPVEYDALEKAVAKCSPPGYESKNLEAFKRGYLKFLRETAL